MADKAREWNLAYLLPENPGKFSTAATALLHQFFDSVLGCLSNGAEAPWSGFKHSGVGREFGAFEIEAFLEPNAILE